MIPVAIFGIDHTNEVHMAYKKSLQEHIANVQEAGQKLGVNGDLLDIHDRSKWTEAEFPGYAYHFHGGGAPNEFAKAWLHHIHNNPHHWQYWMFPDGFTPKGSYVENGRVQMPEDYALEMVADWLGSSKTYTGSWDIANWLIDNTDRIQLHSKTADYVRQVLIDQLAYDIMHNLTFAGEV